MSLSARPLGGQPIAPNSRHAQQRKDPHFLVKKAPLFLLSSPLTYYYSRCWHSEFPQRWYPHKIVFSISAAGYLGSWLTHVVLARCLVPVKSRDESSEKLTLQYLKGLPRHAALQIMCFLADRIKPVTERAQFLLSVLPMVENYANLDLAMGSAPRTAWNAFVSEQASSSRWNEGPRRFKYVYGWEKLAFSDVFTFCLGPMQLYLAVHAADLALENRSILK